MTPYYSLRAQYFVGPDGVCTARHRPLKASERNAIWERDGGVCGICGRELVRFRPRDYSEDMQGHVDHIPPVSRGGSSDPDNLRLVCATTNLSRQVDVGNAWRVCG